MFDELLFPTDGSEPTWPVLDYAIRIASEHDASIHILHVADTSQDSVTNLRGEVIDVLVREGESIVDEAAERVTERGVSAVPVVRQGDPYRTIAEYSRQVDIDLIVMPTHGRRGIQRYLLGSVTERVINAATIPVITVNPGSDREWTYPCRTILIPTDGSRGAELALETGISLAAATGAKLHLFHVVEFGSLGLDLRSVMREEVLAEHADEIIAEARETVEANSVGSITTGVEYGEPVREILDYLTENSIDLAILGTHGRTDFRRFVMGGVSSKLIRTSPVPVMWVREPSSTNTE